MPREVLRQQKVKEVAFRDNLIAVAEVRVGHAERHLLRTRVRDNISGEYINSFSHAVHLSPTNDTARAWNIE